jgi:hypothetical protein
MTRSVVLIIISVLNFSLLSAQDYFQQKVSHKIDVSLEIENKLLVGNIHTTYINNSPDTLSFLYYHLWPNAYSNSESKFAQQQLLLQNSSFYYSDETHRGNITCSNTQIDGVPVEFENVSPNIEDVKIIYLPQELLPGDTLVFETDFIVKLPVVTSRMGYSDNDFCITQWYPKPAVYDNYGWHPMSYLDMGEFYSEFGDFKVNITIPDNYIVAATGSLVSKSELQRLEDYSELCANSKYKENIRAFGDSSKMKTLHYLCNGVHDFAWFASPDFVVERKSEFVDDEKGFVSCWVFYHKDNSALWDGAIEYVSRTIRFMSDNVGAYPFNNCTAVDAPLGVGGGMEYPTITVVSASSKSELERVVAHEIIHNWFYGILASNERANPWIDEGFTSFYESQYINYYYPNLGMVSAFLGKNIDIHGLNQLPPRYTRGLSWEYLMSENIQQPGSLNSEEMSTLNYFILSYQKPVIALYSLQAYLGKEDFKSLMRGFFSTYQNKHIYPEDLKKHFNKHVIKDTNWFFDDFIETNKKPDYKICKLKNDSIIIKNNGECLSPLFLSIGDSMIIVDGFEGKKSFNANGEKNFVIDPDFVTLDLNRKNNYLRKGFLKSNRSVKFSLANFIDNPSLCQIPILPVVLYNYTDGWSPGILLYSSPFPKKKFEYQIMPVFGTKTGLLNGLANFSFFVHPKGKHVREIEFYTSGRRFGIDKDTKDYYYKLASGIKLEFKTNPLSSFESRLLVRNVLARDYYTGDAKNYQQLKYSFGNHSPVNPWFVGLDLQSGQGFVKLATEFSQSINYNEKIGLRIRFFAGKFLYSSNQYYGNYNFRLYGLTGSQDYFYDELFVSRNEDIRYTPKNLWAHQFMRSDGGFTMYSPYGQTDDWLMSLNFDSGTPLGIVDVYFNIGACPKFGETIPDVFYEGGIKLNIFKDFLCVYFPITGTAKVWETSNDIYTNNYLQKIRFTLSLDKINLLNYRNKPYLLF